MDLFESLNCIYSVFIVGKFLMRIIRKYLMDIFPQTRKLLVNLRC